MVKDMYDIILVVVSIYCVILVILGTVRTWDNELISGLYFLWCSLGYASIMLLIVADVLGLSYLYENELEWFTGVKSLPKVLFIPVAILFILFFFGGIRAIKDGKKKNDDTIEN